MRSDRMSARPALFYDRISRVYDTLADASEHESREQGLDERAPLAVESPLADLLVDAIALTAPVVCRASRPKRSTALTARSQRHPGHDPGVHEGLTWAADLPDPVVGLLPVAGPEAVVARHCAGAATRDRPLVGAKLTTTSCPMSAGKPGDVFDGAFAAARVRAWGGR
jgi:hypothetical protein